MYYCNLLVVKSNVSFIASLAISSGVFIASNMWKYLPDTANRCKDFNW